MNKSVFKAVVIGFAVLVLGGCSDFDEMKSKRLLAQAEALMQQGQTEQAESLFVELLAKYPATQAGEVAEKQLAHLQKNREMREREVFAKVIESYRQVLEGYRSLYAEYPRSLPLLDQSGYFFDSAYLEEIVPEGYQVYLWLESGGSGYRLWCVSPLLERSYAAESSGRALLPIKRDDAITQIKDTFDAAAWAGKLVALQVRN